MKTIRWALAYIYFRVEAAVYAFPDPAHYAAWAADLETRQRLK